MKQNDQLKRPFFAKFLEAQQKEDPNQKQSLFPWPITGKGKDDFDQTMKYPSDNDEEGERS